jgi:hypothetical protein
MLQDPDLPLVFTRRQALRLGVTPNAVTWRASHGQWQTLRRGAFCRAETYEQASQELRHLLTALAALAIEGRRETVSHLTAAIAYGWPGPLELHEDPWFTISPESCCPTRRRSGVVRQVAELPVTHMWAYGDLAVTSPARTVADCLRHFPARVSLPIADAAGAQGVDLVEVRRILDWQMGWPYAGRGRQTSELIDGRRESWLESQSALAHHALGLPAPTPQAVILDERGREVARVDFLWTDSGVIGEADGWGKYRSVDSHPPRDRGADHRFSLDALRQEKQREDRLRDLGYEVVRWGASDALSPQRGLADRLTRAFARADPRRVRGSHRAPWSRADRSVHLDRLAELRAMSGPLGLVLPTYPCSTSLGAAG